MKYDYKSVEKEVMRRIELNRDKIKALMAKYGRTQDHSRAALAKAIEQEPTFANDLAHILFPEDNAGGFDGFDWRNALGILLQGSGDAVMGQSARRAESESIAAERAYELEHLRTTERKDMMKYAVIGGVALCIVTIALIIFFHKK